MNKDKFLRQYQERLTEFTCMSRTVGSRADYVQGGGGNTSVKLDDRLMAIKASGFRLEQIDLEEAYALLDYAQLRRFYADNSPENMVDVEKEGAEITRTAAFGVEGLKNLRPSVEAGFHAIMDDFVLHSHSVYANLAACSADGQKMAAKALADLPANHIFAPYVNPGAQLTFTLSNLRRQFAQPDGKQPEIIFMRNHGLIITGPEVEYCLDMHEQVNRRLAKAYGLSFSDWPHSSLRKAGADKNYEHYSDTEWLRNKLLSDKWELENFTDEALYPDQLVFLAGQLFSADTGKEAQRIIADKKVMAKAVIIRQSGEVLYNCGFVEARTIEETLCAILLIRETLSKTGKEIVFMSEAAKGFISNWESEKYRRTIAAN